MRLKINPCLGKKSSTFSNVVVLGCGSFQGLISKLVFKGKLPHYNANFRINTLEIGVGIEARQGPKGLGIFESHFFQFIQFVTPTFLF